ncbi:MAG: cob(I)yrinic acid a,c-diamide adenosyltransferase [Sandaracinaceae bacterium]|nr:cob(I)yrinic acid a,c-diamide adenosyltransferase [Sandaracinaceae bacterium]
MKIYTKVGDAGKTGLFGENHVSKASVRVAAYGNVDELNSVIGLCRTTKIDDGNDALLQSLQSALFNVGAELSTSPKYEKDIGVPLVSDADVEIIEHAIDRAESELEPLKTFVLPGGTPGAAHLHLARTTCRRAERSVVALVEAGEPVRGEVLRYLNRLSDLLFVLARLANHRASVPDVPWVGRGAMK